MQILYIILSEQLLHDIIQYIVKSAAITNISCLRRQNIRLKI